jgi:hypothetical protein
MTKAPSCSPVANYKYEGRRQQNPLCSVTIALHLVPSLILDSFGHHPFSLYRAWIDESTTTSDWEMSIDHKNPTT